MSLYGKNLGKTISLYLMDGTASGRWQVTLVNWSGIVYGIPHSELKKCIGMAELNTPGVYFLFGRDDRTGKPFVYVGEADDTYKRLLQEHSFEKRGDYWTEAIVLVTPDGTLEKGRIKYLENRFYQIAVEAKQYIVKNKNTPKQSPLPQSVRDAMEEFLLTARLILSALRYRVFEPLVWEKQPASKAQAYNPLPAEEQEEDLLYFDKGKGKAVGRITSEGFWVLKGSYINSVTASHLSAGVKAKRAEYASRIDRKGILQEDVCFGSPSFAAAFVCGYSVSGLQAWKNKDGISLKEINAETDSSPKTGADVNQEKGNTASVVEVSSPEPEILHLASRTISVWGYRKGDGFVICKGSGFRTEARVSCAGWILKLRENLLKEKKVQNGVFTEDVFFKSTSAAAACAAGGTMNGRKEWKYADGKSISERDEE